MLLNILHTEVLASAGRVMWALYARADYVAYLDDDAYLPDTWIENAIRVQEQLRRQYLADRIEHTILLKNDYGYLDEYMSGHWAMRRIG